MLRRRTAWERNKAALAGQRRRLARQRSRLVWRRLLSGTPRKQKPPPEPVEPSYARRRLWRALAIVAMAWAAVVGMDAALIRTHAWSAAATGVAAAAGAVGGILSLVIWFGESGTPHASTRQGRALLTARTLTGVRTIDLDALAGVRLFTVVGPGRGDELIRVRDRHGLRLSVDLTLEVYDAIRGAVERAAASRPGGAKVAVSRSARGALGLPPRAYASRSPRGFLDMCFTVAAIELPAVGSYMVACLLAGTKG